MDKMHWMEPSIATRKQERETPKAIGFPSTMPSVAFSQKKDKIDAGHVHVVRGVKNPFQYSTAQCLVPACASHDQHASISPCSQLNSCEGSLNDMLLPYHYAKLLDDLLSEQDEPLVQQLGSTAQIEQGHLPCYTNVPLSLGDRESTVFSFSDAAGANDDIELVSSISKNAMMVSAVPPMPTPTRRPPMHKGTTLYRKNHIHTERQRRQDMTSLFKRLKSVLPGMQFDDLKGDRCTILEHVIDYVQELDKKVQALAKVKEELMQGAPDRYQCSLAQQAALASAESVLVRPWSHVNIFITLNCPKHCGLWPSLLALLQDTLQLDVQNVALSSTPLFWVHSIYAKVMSDDTEEVCSKVKNTLRDFLIKYAHNDRILLHPSSKISGMR